MKRLTIDMSDELHLALRQTALNHKTTVRALMLDCAELTVKSNRPPPPPTLTSEEKPAYIADSPAE